MSEQEVSHLFFKEHQGTWRLHVDGEIPSRGNWGSLGKLNLTLFLKRPKRCEIRLPSKHHHHRHDRHHHESTPCSHNSAYGRKSKEEFRRISSRVKDRGKVGELC